MQPFIPPYGDIVSRLVTSTMSAMSEFLSDTSPTGLTESIPDALLNRHFLWLTPGRRPIRHLFDGGAEFRPLRTLSARRLVDDQIRKKLQVIPIPGSELDAEMAPYIQALPTRISRLLRYAVFKHPQFHGAKDARPLLPSPLSVVADFLTVPDIPASRAYAMLTVRNLLYETLLSNGKADGYLTSEAIEEAYSNIVTYVRRRFWSAGVDAIPSTTGVEGFIRHYLATESMLLLRFSSVQKCREYLLSQDLHPLNRDKFEFYRSPSLQKLPDLDEVVNSTLGLPVPIRGAETLFRGGLRFPSSNGLVCALHGGPGTGKTSLSLAIAASLAPLGVRTVFFTAEEQDSDLRSRAQGLLPAEVRRLPFVTRDSREWLSIVELQKGGDFAGNPIGSITARLNVIDEILRSSLPSVQNAAPMPCRAIVVLDGLHDLLAREIFSEQDNGHETKKLLSILHAFVDKCRELQALVILTTGTNWRADESLDYLVDVAMRLNYESLRETGSKPDRTLTLIKTRHQLCAAGTHGIQISGEKGVRFTPQMNYQIDRRSVWATRLPDQSSWKKVMQCRLPASQYHLVPDEIEGRVPKNISFHFGAYGNSRIPRSKEYVRLFGGSNIFLHGEGSGGKAGLALKIAVAPSFEDDADGETFYYKREKVLIVSFLYPETYYNALLRKLIRLRTREYASVVTPGDMPKPIIDVIHLYPGGLKPDALFSRIDWALNSAELNGSPFTTIIIDGIHNVFLQFPEIEKYALFWPQLYSVLRTRELDIITTHTMLSLKGEGRGGLRIDDRRSDPLRHALVQKTDFRFDVDIAGDDESDFDMPELDLDEPYFASHFTVRTVSAIGQALPRRELCWSREKMIFFDCP